VTTVYLHNIYAPANPASRLAFFDCLPRHVFDHDAVHIVGGDFNVCLSGSLDAILPSVADQRGVQELRTSLEVLERRPFPASAPNETCIYESEGQVSFGLHLCLDELARRSQNDVGPRSREPDVRPLREHGRVLDQLRPHKRALDNANLVAQTSLGPTDYQLALGHVFNQEEDKDICHPLLRQHGEVNAPPPAQAPHNHCRGQECDVA